MQGGSTSRGVIMRTIRLPTFLGLTQVSQQKYKLMFVVSAKSAYYKHNDCASCVSPVFKEVGNLGNLILINIFGLALRSVTFEILLITKHRLAHDSFDESAEKLHLKEKLLILLIPETG